MLTSFRRQNEWAVDRCSGYIVLIGHNVEIDQVRFDGVELPYFYYLFVFFSKKNFALAYGNGLLLRIR